MKNSAVSETRFSIISNSIMLVLVFFIVFVISALPQSWHELLFRLTYTLIFISAVMTISNRRGLMIGIICATIGMEWFSSIMHLSWLDTTSQAWNFSFFAFMVGYYIHRISIARTVTPQVILQAIVGYLLLGLVFSIMVSLLGGWDAAMFNFPATPGPGSGKNFSQYIYFTFVTFTTVGYGDIVPLMPAARSLSILISVAGPLYLAIIIAMLVGKFASQRS